MEVKALSLKKIKELVLNKNTAIILGLAGILIIFLTTLFPSPPKKSAGDNLNQTESAEQYEQMLENKLKKLISSIEGIGNCSVMVTLEAGSEKVYAIQRKTRVDSASDISSDSQKTENTSEDENEYIIISDSDGNEMALVVKQIQPVVKGVVVVCQGGDKLYVKKSVTDAVSTLLGISVNKVCVIKGN